MTNMTKEYFGECVKAFRFKEIFNYFGWDNDRIVLPPIGVEEKVYQLKSIAQKSGFRVIECLSGNEEPIPTRSIRNRIESLVSQMSHDHIIIYTDSVRQKQVWQFVYRTLSQGTKRVEVEYDIRMNPEKIYERTSGLVFDLDEEGKITIIDVIERVKGSLATNSEKVTKRFYDHFKNQRKSMIDSISGISDTLDREWYASLMLNRLMFCYFIQKRRFLNNDMDYLNHKLQESQKKHVDGFFSFYRNFLLVLFHDGLASRERTSSVIDEIGQVPYLNGGLFDLHTLEKKYPDIVIPDETFAKLFAFFDTWDWHLDSNRSSVANEINPDVIGYIFEKYINDRAKLGAYYTKEDISEYMARTSIVPKLMDKIQAKYPIAFARDGEFWRYLAESDDKYIFEPVKYEIDDIEKEFNAAEGASLSQAAANSVNVGRETWADALDRRNRYWNLRNKIDSGYINSTSALVENNIDIETLLYDFTTITEDYGFVYALFDALKDIKIIDPACGSGAFLLAALNVLEPLYECCLSKFEYLMLTNEGSLHAFASEELKSYKDAQDKRYWIFKRILINNLYGVDIISEAAETAKLRLFLRLMACIEPDYTKPNMGIEPLPDIDFNIRSGNSLIGFVTLQDVMKSAADSDKKIVQSISVMAKDLSLLKEQFAETQACSAQNILEREELKEKIQKISADIYELLNKLVFSKNGSDDYESWIKNNKPLHWFAEFGNIMGSRGGFDVAIGNPPYVKNVEVEKNYSLKAYTTATCDNLYTCFVERATMLSNADAVLSMILQLPIVCTDGMEDIRRYLCQNYKALFFATFDDRPGKLFDELQHIRVAIVTGKKEAEKAIFTSVFNRWYSETRANLFKLLHYYRWEKEYTAGSIAKIGDPTLASIIDKLKEHKLQFADTFVKGTDNRVFYHNAPLYWIRGSKFAPYFYNEREGEKTSSQYKTLAVRNEKEHNLLLAVLNSSLFYIWFVVYGDMRHLNKREIETFPVCDITDADNAKLDSLLNDLAADYEKHKVRKECVYAKTGLVRYDEYHPRPSKPYMDLIDTELARLYGLSEDELAYVLNYDVKFRVGGEDYEESEGE